MQTFKTISHKLLLTSRRFFFLPELSPRAMLGSVCLNIAFANISREDQASDSCAKSGYILGICLIFKIISKISYTKK